jgi:stage II sporulation protein D
MKAMKKPEISIGVLSASVVRFELNGRFLDETGKPYQGCLVARLENHILWLETETRKEETGESILLRPEDEENSDFTIFNVTIGINFHWQKQEDQVFRGGLRLIAQQEGIVAINILPVEDYLISVISSEMSSTSSLEMLKAHAVISRSWLLAQIEKSKAIQTGHKQYQSLTQTQEERTVWYDREDHILFDVCADDHCQRYQGITRANTPLVEQAVHETSGEVLIYDNKLCDTRFSKCCGGITELFENAWEPINHPYLQRIYDNIGNHPDADADLTREDEARKWILSDPPAFCNTSEREVLLQVLNDYDQTTRDFYRWKVSYTDRELADLIRNRTGIDFGIILDLIPMERGTSGRLIRLKIVGSIRTMILGKELEIRRALSSTHLYSSAFVVEKIHQGAVSRFILHGAGWGHGVGLCQIGAAVMGARGYSYHQILMHYFRGAALMKRY